jgi:hypothetical protein
MAYWHILSAMAKRIHTKDIERIARLQCSRKEAAAFLGIRASQFDRLLRKDERVRAAWEKGQELGKISLRRKQMRLASVNAPMAIFLGKNILGQKDKITNEHTGAEGGAIEFNADHLNAEERNELRRLITRGSASSS